MTGDRAIFPSKQWSRFATEGIEVLPSLDGPTDGLGERATVFFESSIPDKEPGHRPVESAEQREDAPVEFVTVSLPKHVDEALQRFLDHEVVRVEDAPPGRYDDDHLQEVKRLRHAYEAGSRLPGVVVNLSPDGTASVLHPENARAIVVDWREIEKSSNPFLVEKLAEEIRNLRGTEENPSVQVTLARLTEHLETLAKDE
jgi:hypothetical protein